jgi:nicotinate-nucleotide adenylyltransferase
LSKKIGIYGGSFNPVHLGHLNLAVEIMEAHNLDQVWFCPVAINPFKADLPPISPQHRIKMLSLAIEHEPRFIVCDIEIHRPGLSFTIDTIKELHSQQKDEEDQAAYSLILGEDSARDFHKWHKPEEIVSLIPLLIGSRFSNGKQTFQGSAQILDAIDKGLTPIRIMEISSSVIRERLLNKRYCYHLIPGKVMDYINANHLYYSLLNEVRFL